MTDRNPYASLPAERYWRKAVASVPPFLLDPTRPDAFRLSRTERIATAGSCFAQEVARVIRRAGFNFYVTEEPPVRRDNQLADMEANFSARYGNIYTTRQLVQLFDRAFGHFRPLVRAWEREDGRFVDPFRPRVEPDGYASEAEVVAAQEVHLSRVRHMFETLDTLIFTLGLTEGWRDARDDAALQLAPGVAGGAWDPAIHRFANATVGEMTADMLGFVDKLRAVNPAARIILTVSPVPIAATYSDRHVLVSNAYSKSALRVVADEVVQARPGVFYFPSYDVVTSPATAGRYYSENLRAVTEAGKQHVMRLFMAHLEDGGTPAAPAGALDARLEGERVSTVICDEELLDA
ncbi:MAG: hypothetical protein JWR08_574 [Enterovirga sp.]|nr:hypothetical protein [Enterovirga sp.]